MLLVTAHGMISGYDLCLLLIGQVYEEIRMSGWHRKLHIFTVPFYYIEYGMAQVGAHYKCGKMQYKMKKTAVAANIAKRINALGGTQTFAWIIY